MRRSVVPCVFVLVAAGCGETKTIALLHDTAASRDAGSDQGRTPQGPECAEDGDCAPPKGRCDALTGKCVQCMASDDCATKVCNTVSHTCTGCLTNADCEDPTPLCDGDDRKCVECISAAQCKKGEVCAWEAHRCAPACVTNSECAGSGHPICAAASRVCVECTSNADCNAMNLEPHCDLGRGACVECLADGDCATGHCDTFENRCVECTSNDHCQSHVCDLFACRG